MGLAGSRGDLVDLRLARSAALAALSAPSGSRLVDASLTTCEATRASRRCTTSATPPSPRTPPSPTAPWRRQPQPRSPRHRLAEGDPAPPGSKIRMTHAVRTVRRSNTDPCLVSSSVRIPSNSRHRCRPSRSGHGCQAGSCGPRERHRWRSRPARWQPSTRHGHGPQQKPAPADVPV